MVIRMETLYQRDIEDEFGFYPDELSPFEIQEILEYAERENAEDSFYKKGESVI